MVAPLAPQIAGAEIQQDPDTTPPPKRRKNNINDDNEGDDEDIMKIDPQIAVNKLHRALQHYVASVQLQAHQYRLLEQLDFVSCTQVPAKSDATAARMRPGQRERFRVARHPNYKIPLNQVRTLFFPLKTA